MEIILMLYFSGEPPKKTAMNAAIVTILLVAILLFVARKMIQVT